MSARRFLLLYAVFAPLVILGALDAVGYLRDAWAEYRDLPAPTWSCMPMPAGTEITFHTRQGRLKVICGSKQAEGEPPTSPPSSR